MKVTDATLDRLMAAIARREATSNPLKARIVGGEKRVVKAVVYKGNKPPRKYGVCPECSRAISMPHKVSCREGRQVR